MKRFFFSNKPIKPKKILFDKNKVFITRAGLSSNPVQRYSFTSGDVFANNALVKHGDSFFIGGDTAEYEFDFGLKVAGSVVECPMRVYGSKRSTNILTPNSPITTSVSYTDTQWYSLEQAGEQSNIDLIKTQNSTSFTIPATGVGLYAQLMVELDLTPLCNQLFGGSNSALKTALKSINVDAWCQGSGANGGVLTNGCVAKLWWAGGSPVWGSTEGVNQITNPNSTIVKSTLTKSTLLIDYINSSNKLYILIASQYPSDGTIPSIIQLDYINVKVALNRTPDTVSPIPVKLGKYWAMVVKGFSPAWDSDSAVYKRIFSLWQSDSNRFSLYTLSGAINLSKRLNGGTVMVLPTSVSVNSKNQCINMLVGQNVSGMFAYILKNNGTVTKVSNSNTELLTGQFPLHLLNQAGASPEHANAFAESFHLVDLERIGKSNGFTDAEAEGILRGRVQTKNLFDKSKAIDNGYYDGSGVWNANVAYYSTNYISCKPNASYVHNRPSASYVNFYDANKNRISSVLATSFVTPSNANYFITHCSKANLSIDLFQAEEGSIATAYEPYLENPLGIQNPELFDLSKVTLHPNARIENGAIVLNPTGAWNTSYINIPILPNNRYEITFNKISSKAEMFVASYYNNIRISDLVGTGSVGLGLNGADGKYSSTFTTPNNCNSIRVSFDNNTLTTGTFTFSNISLKRKD